MYPMSDIWEKYVQRVWGTQGGISCMNWTNFIRIGGDVVYTTNTVEFIRFYCIKKPVYLYRQVKGYPTIHTQHTLINQLLR